MQDFSDAFVRAGLLIASADPDLVEIVLLSLQVTLSALAIACLIGLPLGAALAAFRFPGRRAVRVTASAMMGLPPVVVGLLVYMALSNAGPFGVLGLLYTPAAMVIAQVALVTPIVVALSAQAIESLHAEYDEQLRIMGLTPRQTLATLLWEGRFALVTVALAGFGRAVAEVGAVMIVGGNIAHATRVMTTAIALETSKGALSLALALGLILLALSLGVNAAAMALRGPATRGVAAVA